MEYESTQFMRLKLLTITNGVHSMSLTAQFQSYNAKQFNASQKQQLAMKSLSSKRTVTELAQQNNVSRKFVGICIILIKQLQINVSFSHTFSRP